MAAAAGRGERSKELWLGGGQGKPYAIATREWANYRRRCILEAVVVAVVRCRRAMGALDFAREGVTSIFLVVFHTQTFIDAERVRFSFPLVLRFAILLARDAYPLAVPRVVKTGLGKAFNGAVPLCATEMYSVLRMKEKDFQECHDDNNKRQPTDPDPVDAHVRLRRVSGRGRTKQGVITTFTPWLGRCDQAQSQLSHIRNLLEMAAAGALILTPTSRVKPCPLTLTK